MLLGLEGVVSKRTSPDWRREMEKPNGVVVWSVKTRSESASKSRVVGDGVMCSDFGCGGG